LNKAEGNQRRRTEDVKRFHCVLKIDEERKEETISLVRLSVFAFENENLF
jgi:hypothetical protein